MKEFIKELGFTNGKYKETDIFFDVIKLTSYFIQTNIFLNIKTEKEFYNIFNKYNQNEKNYLLNLIIKLCALFDKQKEPIDLLGKIYHELNANSKQLGQFFTPVNLQELCANLAGINEEELKQNGFIRLDEPSSGSGGMVVAYANYMKKKGYDYRKSLLVHTKDLDLHCFFMCYVQLSMYDIPAIVECGDTLAMTTYMKFETPQYMFGNWKNKERNIKWE